MESATLIVRELKAQAELYRVLAGALRSHPTEESVRTLGAITSELGLPCPASLSLSELDREYMELFAIPGPRYVAPYESVFRDHWLLPPMLKRGSDPRETGQTVKGLLMGESTLAVRNCYLRSGLLPEEELPDHISNELYFLAYLCEKEAEAPSGEARSLAETRERFRRDHVSKWIGELREKVKERDRLGYYSAILQVAEAVLVEEEDQEEPARDRNLRLAGS
jgi:TorA maturation chaperone TorD